MRVFDAYTENVMLGPTRELLERRLIGQFKITALEIRSMYSASQDAFVALLQARLIDTIGRMADVAIGRDDVRDYNHMRGEFPRMSRSAERESRFWKVMNGPPVLDFERSPRWWIPESDAEHQKAQRDFHALQQAVRAELPKPPVQIITTPAIKARYAATLERLMRERNEAAFEWSRLRPWQWRKRRRLWRTLYGIGGWRVDVGPVDYGIPERVTPCGRLGRLREGGC